MSMDNRRYIGPIEFTKIIPLEEHCGDGPEVEVEVEGVAELYCHDPEDGIEVEHITAKIVGRELDDQEISSLDLHTVAIEQFEAQFPVSPEEGVYTRYDGSQWKVLGSGKLDGQPRMLVWIEEHPPYITLSKRRLTVDATRFSVAAAEWPCGGIHPEFVKGTKDDPRPPEGEWHPAHVADLLTPKPKEADDASDA